MKSNYFYVIYSRHQTVEVFTQDYRKFKKQFFKLTKKISLTPNARITLRNYLLIKDFFSVNKILCGNLFIAEYTVDEVYTNVTTK